MAHVQATATVVTTPLHCIECGRAWLVDSERWRVKLMPEEWPPETVPYCPDCHEREFGVA